MFRKRVRLVNPIVSTKNQPPNAGAALSYWAKKNPEAILRVSIPKGVVANYIQTETVRDVVASGLNIFDYMKEAFGGGSYKLEFCQGDVVENTYKIGIAGPPGEYSKRESSGEGRSSGKQSDLMLMFTQVLTPLLTAIIASMQGGGSTDQVMKMLELVIAKMGNGEEMALSKELIFAFLNDKGGSQLDDMLKYKELFQGTPQIQQAEPLTALVSGLAPTIGQLIANRNAGGPAVTTQSVIQELQRLGVNIPGLPAAQQPGQLPAQNVAIAPPGAQTPTLSAVPAQPAPVSQDETVDTYISPLIEKFRSAVQAGASVESLATDLDVIVQRQRSLADHGMHPLLEGFVKHTDPLNPLALQADFNRFCDAIPEFSNREGLRIQLQNELVQAFNFGVEPEAEPVITDAEIQEQMEVVNRELQDILGRQETGDQEDIPQAGGENEDDQLRESVPEQVLPAEEQQDRPIGSTVRGEEHNEVDPGQDS